MTACSQREQVPQTSDPVIVQMLRHAIAQIYTIVYQNDDNYSQIPDVDTYKTQSEQKRAQVLPKECLYLLPNQIRIKSSLIFLEVRVWGYSPSCMGPWPIGLVVCLLIQTPIILQDITRARGDTLAGDNYLQKMSQCVMNNCCPGQQEVDIYDATASATPGHRTKMRD